jgi:hypothetical protein
MWQISPRFSAQLSGSREAAAGRFSRLTGRSGNLFEETLS